MNPSLPIGYSSLEDMPTDAVIEYAYSLNFRLNVGDTLQLVEGSGYYTVVLVATNTNPLKLELKTKYRGKALRDYVLEALQRDAIERGSGDRYIDNPPIPLSP
jgi:hypothetical protein